jgi:hypothetical protein
LIVLIVKSFFSMLTPCCTNSMRNGKPPSG